MRDVMPVIERRSLYVRRIADGPTQRVPLPPPLLATVQVGDLVLVVQTEGKDRTRLGSIIERPHLRSNRCTVRYADVDRATETIYPQVARLGRNHP